MFEILKNVEVVFKKLSENAKQTMKKSGKLKIHSQADLQFLLIQQK